MTENAGDGAARDVVDLSHGIWTLMAERDTAALAELIHDDAMFVHMGATMSKSQELDVIAEGQIVYQQADIEQTSVPHLSDTTAIVLTRLTLVAVLGGVHEVTNPFAVTQTWTKQDRRWRLLALAFTRLLTPDAAAPSD